LALLEAILKDLQQFVATSENDLVEEDLQSLLMKHVVQIDHPHPVNRPVRQEHMPLRTRPKWARLRSEA
jgi:hypothetical protein